MALIGRFIGVDKYLDGNIRDLTGAKRDATALWALFTDTIKDIQSELIVDGDAKLENVEKALQDTLDAAGPDDTLIFSFAGHGTKDHKLVLHDTNSSSLTSTTLPMQDLATRFKQSKAKAILLILDCCFSGDAPARVLESSAIPRDPTNPLQDFEGKGRILISASNIDEPSYETPGTGHGLLTKAIMDVLQSETDTVDLSSAIGDIMERVRAEASRIGVKQTPVMFGSIEGGLTLPSLKAGSNYYSAFPEKKGHKISSAIKELELFGIPSTITSEWANRFNSGLNELQLEAINDFRILDGDSLLVVAPTSSGKTFIGELAATKSILEGKKAVFLLPYRALTSEKYDQFVELYGEKMQMRVIRCTGDYQDQTESFVRGKYDLALLTYEMFLNISVGSPNLLHTIGLVVLDEGQFITDPNRGISVELLLTHLLNVRERGIHPQLIVLSAVIGDTNNFESWLGCRKLITDKRPVPLTEGVMDRDGTFQFKNPDDTTQTSQLLPQGSIYVRKDKPGAQDMIVPLVKSLIQQGEKVIVFRNQKGPAKGCANYLANELGLPPAQDALDELPIYDLSIASTSLRACLQGGTSFHNTDLSREERAVVEKHYRNPNSKVRVLAATTTVAAGINTPASTVIIAEQEFKGEDGRPFTIAEYKNMAGRAGRLGFNQAGRSIILAENSSQREHLFNHYVLGKLDTLESSFKPTDLDTWIIRLFAQVKKIPKAEVSKLLANTYGGYLANTKNPNWRTENEQQISDLLNRMISLELVEEENGYVKLTLLGMACGKSALKFESTLRLVELLKSLSPQDLTPEKLMAILQVLPESDGGYTPVFKRGTSEAVRVNQASTRYGRDIALLLQRHAEDNFDYYGRCKRASILYDWVNGKPLDQIERDYTTNPFSGVIGHGDVRKFADATRFHLRAAFEILTLIFPDNGISEEAISKLLKQLEVGIPSDTLELLTLPTSLARGQYLTLSSKGIKTLENIKQQPLEILSSILNQAQLEQIKKIV